MAGRERMRLTDTAIARLRPREREYTVWDSRVAGLGVRVRPTGGHSWVLLLDAGGRSKRVSLGPVSTKSVEEVRRECHARKANLEPGRMESAARPVPLFRDFVAGAWKETHFDGYKPSTRKASAISWQASFCRLSGRSGWTALPRPASGAGSTGTAGPRRAMPITRSPAFGRS